MKRFLHAAKRCLSESLSPQSELPATLAKRLLQLGRPISFIDIGASKGTFSRALKKTVPIERGILIEPQPDHAAELSAEYLAPRYTVLPFALSAQPGLGTFFINEQRETSSLLRINSRLHELDQVQTNCVGEILTPIKTLDEVFVDSSLGRVDLIKIDTQGTEREILQGGVNCLAHTHLLWVEASFKPLYHGSCLFHEVHSALVDQGFLLMDVVPGFRSPEGELLQVDAMFESQ